MDTYKNGVYNPPTLYMMVGLPGSGKSTACMNMIRKNQRASMLLSTDNYIETRAAQLGKSYAEIFEDTIKDATANLEYGLKLCVEHDWDIYWDQTNLGVATRAKKLARIPDHYYKAAFVYEVDDEQLKHRLENRHVTDGKFISWNLIESMKRTYERPDLSTDAFDMIFYYKDNRTEKRG